MFAPTENLILQMRGSTECSRGSCRRSTHYAFHEDDGVWPLCPLHATAWREGNSLITQQRAYRILLEYTADALAFTTACCLTTVVQHLWQPRAIVGIFECLRCRRLAYCLECATPVTAATRDFFRPLVRCSEHASPVSMETTSPIVPLTVNTHQVVMEIAQHPVTRRYQPWMALYGEATTTVSMLSSHRTLVAARQVVEMASAALRQGASVDIPTWVEVMTDGDVPDPLPYADMATIQDLFDQVTRGEVLIVDGL